MSIINQRKIEIVKRLIELSKQLDELIRYYHEKVMTTIEKQIEIMQHFATFDFRIKKQKETITIEKWLVFLPDEDEYKAIETSNIKSYESTLYKVIKSLDTYEVEL